MSLDERRLLGCVYIDPAPEPGQDADVWFWARQSELAGGLESALETFLPSWLGACWPFETVRINGSVRTLDKSVTA